MKRFKIASLTGMSYLSKMLVTLFIIKQISILYGPVGLGFFGNFITLASLASTLGGGGILSGIIKYLAEYSGSLKRQQSFAGSSFLYTLFFSLLTLALGVIFIQFITGHVFPNQDYQPYIYFFLFAQVLVSLNNFSYGVANGLQKNHVYALFLIGGNMIAFMVSFYCLKFYGPWGAIIAIMAPIVFPLIPISMYVFSQRLSGYLRFDSFVQDSRLLAKYSVMRFGSAICFPIVEIIVMNQIKGQLGLTEAGFWQAITKLSTAYLSFYSLFLTFYFLPLISSKFEKRLIGKEVKKTIVFFGLSFICMLLVYLTFNNFIIHSFLSTEFLRISDLMVLQMIADFFRVIGWVIGFVAIAKASTKLYLAGEFFQGVLFVTISRVALNSYHDLRAIIVSYLITCVLYCMLSFVLFLFFMTERKEGVGELKLQLS